MLWLVWIPVLASLQAIVSVARLSYGGNSRAQRSIPSSLALLSSCSLIRTVQSVFSSHSVLSNGHLGGLFRTLAEMAGTAGWLGWVALSSMRLWWSS